MPWWKWSNHVWSFAFGDIIIRAVVGKGDDDALATCNTTEDDGKLDCWIFCVAATKRASCVRVHSAGQCMGREDASRKCFIWLWICPTIGGEEKPSRVPWSQDSGCHRNSLAWMETIGGNQTSHNNPLLVGVMGRTTKVSKQSPWEEIVWFRTARWDFRLQRTKNTKPLNVKLFISQSNNNLSV